MTYLIIALLLVIINLAIALWLQIRARLHLKEEFIAAKNRINEMETKDSLTGIHNRLYLNAYAEKLYSMANRMEFNLSALLIDIDRFKQINESYGQKIGDESIVKLTTTVKDQLRESDIFVRYGGEEFVVILPNTSLDDAVAKAEMICKSIKSGDFQFPFTVSIGVATQSKITKNMDNIILAADKKLKEAKKTGRNRVCS